MASNCFGVGNKGLSVFGGSRKVGQIVKRTFQSWPNCKSIVRLLCGFVTFMSGSLEIVYNDGSPGPFSQDCGWMKRGDEGTMVAVVSAIVEDRAPPTSNSVRTMQCPKRCSSKADNKAWLKSSDMFLKVCNPLCDVVIGKATVKLSETLFASFCTGKKPLFQLVSGRSLCDDVGKGEAAGLKDAIALADSFAWRNRSIARSIQSSVDCRSI
jgi:hypothetical protein